MRYFMFHALEFEIILNFAKLNINNNTRIKKCERYCSHSPQCLQKTVYLYLHHKEEKTHYETSLSYRTRMATLSIGYSPTGHDVHNSNC